MKFWRDWQAPLIDDFAARPFADIARVRNDPIDPSPGLSSGAWLGALSDETLATLIDGVYLNFLEGEEALARSRDGFSPEAYRCLQAVKAHYDTDNRFSHSAIV